MDRNPDEPDRPTNSGKNAYVLTEEVAEVLKAYGTPGFDAAVAAFIEQFGTLKAAYERARASHRIPLRLPDGSTVDLSPGEHNALQVAIIEEFGPRFAPGAMVLYVGDTAKKHVIYEQDQLARLGVPITEHDKLPDVVLFDPAKELAVPDRGGHLARAGFAEAAPGDRGVPERTARRSGSTSRRSCRSAISGSTPPTLPGRRRSGSRRRRTT